MIRYKYKFLPRNVLKKPTFEEMFAQFIRGERGDVGLRAFTVFEISELCLLFYLISLCPVRNSLKLRSTAGWPSVYSTPNFKKGIFEVYKFLSKASQ